nr:cation-transporting P-type ATPase [Rhodoglobus sp.]
MSDACGCGHDEAGSPESGQREPEKLWEVSEIRFATVSGVFLLAAWIASLMGAAPSVVRVLEVVSLLVGASTFVPSTLRRLAQGKIGVGTLMTIAAVGAVILGEVGEAAMLAFLFSISEGLEEYSLV